MSPEMSLIYAPCLCNPSRPPRPAERKAHRAASGNGSPFARAAAEAKPPSLSATVRQTAPENDGPASDRHRPRPPHPAAEEDRGGHLLTPTAAGDHEGLVLELNRKKRTSREREVKERIKRFYF